MVFSRRLVCADLAVAIYPIFVQEGHHAVIWSGDFFFKQRDVVSEETMRT